MPFPIRPLHLGKFVPPPYAGMETHVDTLLDAISGQAEPTLVASEPAWGIGRPAEATRYRVIPVPYYAMLASVPICPAILSVAQRELSSGRANLLHVHAPNPWGDLAAIRAPRNTPVVLTWHSDIVRQRALLKMYGPVQQRALMRADRIVVFTPRHYDSSAQLRSDALQRKVTTVPIGIDFARLDGVVPDVQALASLKAWADGRPVILTVGRHVYYKGYQHLIGAIARMSSNAVLVMVGAGPLTSELVQRATQLGLSKRVKFLGEVDQSVLASALRTCDVFCLPSIEQSEAFGIASAEAMAYGKPTVVCQLNNGVNYLNREGVTSLVVPPRDEAALSDTLDQLVRDDALRQRMGIAASAWVREEFGVAAMRDGTLALYRSLL